MKAIRELCEANRTLGEKIGDFLSDFVQSLREAFGGQAAHSPEAQILMQYAEELQRLWDEGFKAAVENRQAGKKNTAPKGGVKYAKNTRRAYGTLREKLAKEGLDALSEKLGDRFPLSAKFDQATKNDTTPLVMSVVREYGVRRNRGETAFAAGRRAFTKAYGGTSTTVTIRQLGVNVELNESIVGESLAKKTTGVEIQRGIDIVPKLKSMLENGRLLGIERVHVDNQPTAIYGYRIYNMYWQRAGSGQNAVYKPFAIVATVVQDYSGSSRAYVFREIEIVTAGRQSGVPNAGIQPSTSGHSSQRSWSPNRDTYNVSQLYDLVKGIPRDDGGLAYTEQQKENLLFPYTEREDGTHYSVSDSVSDRALLLEASEREGAGASEDLRHFANRMKELESLQRRLERQEKKLEGLREENERAAEGVGPYGKEAAALEGRIAETREAIAKLEERLDQLERGAKLQREVKALRERWFSQNAAEAVQVQTEIQRENRELREALDFYKQQAKLTPAEQRKVRPQDVARFARALLKEHGSEADLDTVREKLQAIGDYLVSGDGINGKEYRDACREVARLIADETYVQAEDAAANMPKKRPALISSIERR